MERDQGNHPPPEDIRDQAIARFSVLAKAKFDEGQDSHGGCILDRDLVGEIENEAIDLWFYVSGLRRKLDEARRRQQSQEGGEL